MVCHEKSLKKKVGSFSKMPLNLLVSLCLPHSCLHSSSIRECPFLCSLNQQTLTKQKTWTNAVSLIPIPLYSVVLVLVVGSKSYAKERPATQILVALRCTSMILGKKLDIPLCNTPGGVCEQSICHFQFRVQIPPDFQKLGVIKHHSSKSRFRMAWRAAP